MSAQFRAGVPSRSTQLIAAMDQSIAEAAANHLHLLDGADDY
jgi:hypothetical protein